MVWHRWPRWPRDNPRDLARYVLPEAIYLLRQPDRSFDLAQQPDAFVHAIYDLLCKHHISYAREEFSTHEVSQYIRTPEEILDSGKGTCLELAVLFCGLCLGNNLLPLLILFENHAITAVSLNHDLSEYNAGDRKEIDDYFKNGVLDRDQLKALQELVKREQYLAIECTGFAKADFPDSSYPESRGRVDGLLPFKQARDAGEAQFYNSNRKFRCAIDIATLQYALDYDPYHSDRYLKLKNIQQPDRDDLLERRLRSFVSGTREKELEEVKKLIEQCLSKGGYIVITGRASQGKTSLLAKLVEDYSQKQRIAYHFIPVHPSPAHQVTLLRSIMANLALKHPYLPYLWVDNEDRGGLVDNFKAVLKEISKREEREVIFIDGLDQILPESDTAKRDLSFLLEDLPAGIVIVVSTRPDDVLQPLQLKTSPKLYELPNLSQSDFEKFLEYRGLHLATEDANSLYEKYLALVTQELPQVGSLSPDQLIGLLQDNPAELFGIALEQAESHSGVDDLTNTDNDILALAIQYHSEIKKKQSQLSKISNWFNIGNNVGRDHCTFATKFLNSLREIVQPFSKLLDGTRSTEPRVDIVQFRSSLMQPLHLCAWLLDELVGLIPAFRQILVSSKVLSRDILMRQENIHSHLESLDKSLREINMHVTLYETLHEFNLPQLKLFYLKLGVAYKDGLADAHEMKISKLIEYCKRNNKYEELIQKVLVEYPNRSNN